MKSLDNDEVATLVSSYLISYHLILSHVSTIVVFRRYILSESI